MKRKELNTIFKKHSQDLFLLALAYVKDKDQAEDIVQSSFLKTWENRHRVNNPFQFLKKTVVNESINEIRNKEKRKNIEQIFVDIETVNNIPSKDFCEKHEKVKDILNSMSEDVRSTMVLKCVQSYKYSEIAEDMGITKAAVKSRLRRGYRIFKNQLIFLMIMANKFFCFFH